MDGLQQIGFSMSISSTDYSDARSELQFGTLQIAKLMESDFPDHSSNVDLVA